MEALYILENEDFDISKILNSGQNVEFKKEENFKFKIKNVEIESYTENGKTYFNINKDFFDKYLYDYFDMKTNYKKIRKEIEVKFPELSKYINYGKGIRFIKQDFLENSTAFIISQNNNIPRILDSMKKIREYYGEGNFPSLEILKTLKKEDFRKTGVGFRDIYLENFFKEITEEKILEIKNLDTLKAKEELMKFKGIGPKVANCILLFSLEKRDVFPVDTHIKKIMEKIYFNENDMSVKEIEDFAIKKFGKYASYIQQYLFFYQINNKI